MTRSRTQRRRVRGVPAFAPVPLRARIGGWTPMKQAAFLGAFAETGSVLAAARKVGMSRETAYRLRGKRGAGSFAAAWDAVAGHARATARKVTVEELRARAFHGLLKPLIYRGRHVSTARKADNCAVLRLLAAIGRGNAPFPGNARDPARFAPGFASTPRRPKLDSGPPASSRPPFV